jgi:hypothetical protein
VVISLFKVEVEVNLQPTVSRPVCPGVRRLLVPATNFSFTVIPPGHWVPFLSPLTKVKVEVTLRPTVSWPVRFGVLLLLEQVTRYIYLSDNYFLYFSCRAPSLMKGRVCNLQCNDISSISSSIATDGLSASLSRSRSQIMTISSYIATDGLLVSSSWCRAPNGAHIQILMSLFDSYFVFSV